MERSKAESLAAKLDGMVSAKVLPGLLPQDVGAAAGLLREQDAELTSLRAALATKQHIVKAKAEREHYRLKIRGEFVIADPRIYFGEIVVDDRAMFVAPQSEWELRVARQLTRAATADWIRDMDERAYHAVRTAIAMEARQGRDGETRLDPKDDSAGRKASPNTTREGTPNAG